MRELLHLLRTGYGTTRTFRNVRSMSAVEGKAVMRPQRSEVSEDPKQTLAGPSPVQVRAATMTCP